MASIATSPRTGIMRGVVDSGSRETLISLAGASERLRGIAAYLRRLPEVTSVESTCRLASISTEGTEVVSTEWYTVAEFDNGRALDFGLELAWSGGEWTVVPTILVTHGAGQDALIALPTSHAVDQEDMLRELRVASELLLAEQGHAVKSFNEWRA